MSISSQHNLKIKNILRLYKKRERNKSGLFIIEGYREITRALENKLSIDSLFLCPDFFSKYKSDFSTFTKQPSIKTHHLTTQLFSKISYREHPDGYLAIFHQPDTLLPDNLLPKTTNPPIFLVLESPEKPGNLGAILRTADATQVNAIIICDPKLDIFNPNVIRSACGTFFSRPIFVTSSTQILKLLKKHHIQIIATTPHTKKFYYQTNLQLPSAIIMGTEHEGLSPTWLKHAHQKIKIPMLGQADSLNLSVSSAIILYEAIRQRQ